MALRANKGEWSEPYVLLKLLAEGKLYLGDANFEQVKNTFYPILTIIRHEKEKDVEFTCDSKIIIKNGLDTIEIDVAVFVEKAKLCFQEIKKKRVRIEGEKPGFEIPEIEAFLTELALETLKTKSGRKDDITIIIDDSKSISPPRLGFSIKSQLGSPSTLVNASKSTNFIYRIEDVSLTNGDIEEINSIETYPAKLKKIASLGGKLIYERPDNETFHSNLLTIDSHFDTVIAKIILLYYSRNTRKGNSIAKYVDIITEENPLNYNLKPNSKLYQMMMSNFLRDYALGMRANDAWTRDYEATGGYIVVRRDGELVCYHFYFAKTFEEYLYSNTKMDTPKKSKHGFGIIYRENNILRIMLNLQIRFIK